MTTNRGARGEEQRRRRPAGRPRRTARAGPRSTLSMTILSGHGFSSSSALTSTTWASDQASARSIRPQVCENRGAQALHADRSSPAPAERRRRAGALTATRATVESDASEHVPEVQVLSRAKAPATSTMPVATRRDEHRPAPSAPRTAASIAMSDSAMRVRSENAQRRADAQHGARPPWFSVATVTRASRPDAAMDLEVPRAPAVVDRDEVLARPSGSPMSPSQDRLPSRGRSPSRYESAKARASSATTRRRDRLLEPSIGSTSERPRDPPPVALETAQPAGRDRSGTRSARAPRQP